MSEDAKVPVVGHGRMDYDSALVSHLPPCEPLYVPREDLGRMEAERDAAVVAKERAEAEADVMRTVLLSVQAVMESSRGVDGWHLNGDIATWDEVGLPSEVAVALSSAPSSAARVEWMKRLEAVAEVFAAPNPVFWPNFNTNMAEMTFDTAERLTITLAALKEVTPNAR